MFQWGPIKSRYIWYLDLNQRYHWQSVTYRWINIHVIIIVNTSFVSIVSMIPPMIPMYQRYQLLFNYINIPAVFLFYISDTKYTSIVPMQHTVSSLHKLVKSASFVVRGLAAPTHSLGCPILMALKISWPAF